jgi:hypothetical protein
MVGLRWVTGARSRCFPLFTLELPGTSDKSISLQQQLAFHVPAEVPHKTLAQFRGASFPPDVGSFAHSSGGAISIQYGAKSKQDYSRATGGKQWIHASGAAAPEARTPA